MTIETNHPPAPHIKPASLGKRLAAMVYDGMLLIGLLFLATALLAVINGDWNMASAPVEGETVHELPPVLSGPAYQLYLMLVIYLFNCYFWWKNGQTLGMQSWRLKVVSAENDAPPSWGQCSMRWAVSLVSLLLAGLGYWWSLWQRDGRSWHDLASNTRVIQLPKTR